MKWPTAASLACLALLVGLPAAAGGLNPPVSNETPGQPVTLSLRPSAEFRCFLEAQTREQSNWNTPTSESGEYRFSVRPWRDAAELSIETKLLGHPVKASLGLDGRGNPLDAEPRIQTTLPNFEKEYRSELLQATEQMRELLKGPGLATAKQVGQVIEDRDTDICRAAGLQSNSKPKARTLVKGTLELAGRSSALLEYTGSQTCLANNVRVNIEVNSWDVRDQLSGLPVSTGFRFEAFAQGNRVLRIDRFMECTLVAP